MSIIENFIDLLHDVSQLSGLMRSGLRDAGLAETASPEKRSDDQS